jgi:hypothetical protein
VCIVFARRALTESISTHKLRRDNTNLYVQGVQGVRDRACFNSESSEETA